jgi:hypothetical protein
LRIDHRPTTVPMVGGGDLTQTAHGAGGEVLDMAMGMVAEEGGEGTDTSLRTDMIEHIHNLLCIRSQAKHLKRRTHIRSSSRHHGARQANLATGRIPTTQQQS